VLPSNSACAIPLADLVEVRGRFALNHPDVAHF
jgi:hypothetical protein